MSTKKEEPDWYADHGNIAALIRYLVAEGEIDLPNVARVVEKPWQYETEWAAYQVAFAAECAEDVKRMAKCGAR